MIEVIDEFYSTNLAQDTIRGMKENTARGFYNGGIPAIGYKTRKIVDGSTKRNVLEPDEHFAPIIDEFSRCMPMEWGLKKLLRL